MTAPRDEEEQRQNSGPNINLNSLSPPTMRTLMYSPDVQVFIAHGDRQIDVSSDLVRGTLIRKENSASTLFLTLANKEARYNGKLSPMDRITVFMKRIKWVQVFSGYLDTVPYAQLYQGVIQIKATCTIKRLLHTWWNPGLPDSAALFEMSSHAMAVGGRPEARDAGLGSLLQKLLTEVGGWDPSNIHISEFPVKFYNELAGHLQRNQAANREAVERFRHMLLGDNITGGSGRWASANPGAGAPGPIGAGQAFYVSEIVAAADELGLGPITLDHQTGQSMQQAGAGLMASRDDAIRGAGEVLSQAGQHYYSSTRNNDGAILGVACALGEGNGTIRNLANPVIPESLQYANDGLGHDHDSVGIFQQRNFAEWGHVSQRMNPRQSARMFFQHLARIEGWRNMDPGQAIYQVQRGGTVARFNSFIPMATQLVQAYREAQAGAASTITSNPLTGAASSAAGAAGIDITDMVNSAVGAATRTPDLAGVRSQLGKPVPDSEGAVMTALAQIGKPYQWGAQGPLAFDCSGLMYYSFRSIGLDIGRTTEQQLAKGTPVSPAGIRRGDLIFPHRGHVQMYIEPGVILHSSTDGVPVGFGRMPDLNTVAGIRRYADNGGPDPTAPRMDPALLGPGMAPGTGTISGAGGAGGSVDEGIARNLFSYIFDPATFASDVASMWGGAGGHKDFIDAQPLIQMVQAVCRASLRNFQSAPNGDIIAYYPDHFGLEGKPAILRLEDIELKSVHINQSDDQLTTHVYVAGDLSMHGMGTQVEAWLNTAGVATIEDDWLFSRLRQIGLGDSPYKPVNGQAFMRQYGVRPYQEMFSMAGRNELEFLLATQVFMEKWAAQYETQASMTFMPELFPGMRVVLGDHNLQVYVSEVVHDFDFENGFTTSAHIMAPTKPNARDMMARTTSAADAPNSITRLTGEYLP